MPVDTATTMDENIGSLPVNEFDPHWCHEPAEQSEPGDPQQQFEMKVANRVRDTT
jgi:hypothetical protein